jgi:hypothetical protein
MKKLHLLLTAAVVLEGNIATAGAHVTVDGVTGANLLARNKAVKDPSKADAPAEGDEDAQGGPTDAEILAHVLKAEEMTEEQFAALSDKKRAALLKAAAAQLQAA